VTADLAVTLLARRPFRPGTREDGTPLADYFDGHRVLGDPRLLAALANELYLSIAGTDADLVAGEVAAGAQLATAVALASVRHPRVVESRGIRRFTKDYGASGLLTSPAPPASRVAVVDDVAGTGAAGMRCVDALREAGHDVVGVFVLLDRCQGARETLASASVMLTSLFRLPDLLPN
jgi:orotate phosphoribosyltransferase